MADRLSEIERRILELERKDWAARTALEANRTSAEEARTYAERGLRHAAEAVRKSESQPHRNEFTCVNREGDMTFEATCSQSYIHSDEYQMRKWALGSALVFNELPEHVIERATAYLKFLKGEDAYIAPTEASDETPDKRAA